jgi:hypothetical protein
LDRDIEEQHDVFSDRLYFFAQPYKWDRPFFNLVSKDRTRLRFHLRRAALEFLSSSERDNRCNALEILSWLAETNTNCAPLADLLYATAREADDSLLVNPIERIIKAAPQIPESLSHYLHFAFLRSGVGPLESPLFESLPEMIRLHASVHKEVVNANLVSPHELIAILDRRIHALFAGPPQRMEHPKLGRQE